jgi:hypothetical protein
MKYLAAYRDTGRGLSHVNTLLLPKIHIYVSCYEFIAAMNYCPCGFYGDTQKPFTCEHALVTNSLADLAGYAEIESTCLAEGL